MLKRNMKNRLLLYCCFFVSILYPATAFANSSWHWVTVSPMKVLPLAIVLTLAVETWGIVVYGKVKDKTRVFVIVTLANIASFITPYIFSTCRLYKFYMSGWSYAWNRAFNSGPHYMIQSAFLILTLCIELPLVYFLLRKHTAKKRQLLLAITIANVATTVIVAVMERLLCRGRW